VSTGKWSGMTWVCLVSACANERLLLRRQVGDRQEQTTLAQKWIAFIDSVFRVVLGSGAWPEVIRMHAGVARSAADSKRRAVLGSRTAASAVIGDCKSSFRSILCNDGVCPMISRRMHLSRLQTAA
jgi:hypothetical protein